MILVVTHTLHLNDYVFACSHAKGEPGTAAPFINGPWTVSNINGFLLLMSDGLFETYGKIIGSTKPQQIHNGLAKLVADEMQHHASLEGVAQAVVEGVKYSYKQKAMKGKLDDITLIIYNFGYSFPHSVPQKIPDHHFQSQYSHQGYPPAHPSYPPPIVHSSQHYRPPPSMPLQPSEGYFSPNSTSPPHGISFHPQIGAGTGYPANYPAEREPFLNVGQHIALGSSSSDSRLDQYHQDNSHYPASNVTLGVNRQQPVPMQRVSSGPLHFASDLSEAVGGMHLSPQEPRAATPQQGHYPWAEHHVSQQPSSRMEEHWEGGVRSPMAESDKTVTPTADNTDSPGRQPAQYEQSEAASGDPSCIASYVKFPEDFPHNLGIDDF